MPLPCHDADNGDGDSGMTINGMGSSLTKFQGAVSGSQVEVESWKWPHVSQNRHGVEVEQGLTCGPSPPPMAFAAQCYRRESRTADAPAAHTGILYVAEAKIESEESFSEVVESYNIRFVVTKGGRQIDSKLAVTCLPT
jgi:hypothetical protein